MALETYRRKRNFKQTPEPDSDDASIRRRNATRAGKTAPGNRFVVQEHHARRLHYDLRLEMGGVLKSWAVPKGPSLNPADKRLAVLTEDHPIKYLHFEGRIPEGNYGAGDMAIWDAGTFVVLEGDPEQQFERGKLSIVLHGNRLHGQFNLVRLREENQWLLLKANDEYADADWQLTQVLGDSNSTKSTQKAAGRHGAARRGVDAGTSSTPSEGRRSPMPDHIQPMLSTSVNHPPAGDDWLYEIKWDGYRAVCFVRRDEVRLLSRRQIALGSKFPEIESALSKLPARSAVIDGEIVVLDREGKPSFQLLQNRAGLYSQSRGRKRNSRRSGVEVQASDALAAETPLLFYAFDLLYLDGMDLRELPLVERKQRLRLLLEKASADADASGWLRYSDHVKGAGSGEQLLEHARKLGLEGIIAKRASSAYKEHRSEHWQKIKLVETVDVVIGGYTAPRRSRSHFGALVIGLFDGKELRYVGHTGSGFNRKTLQETFELLQPLVTERCPFAEKPHTNEPAIWVKPKIVCEVKYTEWTQDGNLRHPIFQALRFDKDPKECTFEAAKIASEPASEEPADSEPPTNRETKRRSTRVLPVAEALSSPALEGDISVDVEGAAVQLTNLDKVYWPDDGFTKGDLVRYYFQIAPVLLPYLHDRPLILQRFPNGIGGKSFHQHNVQDTPEFVQTFNSQESGGVVRYALCNNLSSLLFLVNLGTIAQHIWHSRVGRISTPDWAVFDLDPGPEVEYSDVCRLALEVRDILKLVGLQAYAKTSGSEGMHVYVPFQPEYSYDQLDLFNELVANTALRRRPDLVTLERALHKRPDDRIYLDYMQNKEGKTVVSPWSVRARPGATVSTPLTWPQVQRLPDPSEFTMSTVPKRIAKSKDPFRFVLEKPQSLNAVLPHLDKLK